jgi:hypothetical protein
MGSLAIGAGHSLCKHPTDTHADQRQPPCYTIVLVHQTATAPGNSTRTACGGGIPIFLMRFQSDEKIMTIQGLGSGLAVFLPPRFHRSSL